MRNLHIILWVNWLGQQKDRVNGRAQGFKPFEGTSQVGDHGNVCDNRLLAIRMGAVSGGNKGQIANSVIPTLIGNGLKERQTYGPQFHDWVLALSHADSPQ
jgi:hypothetical protein